MFKNRLIKNIKHLKRWKTKNNIQAYRIYDADMPEYALAIDLYNIENTSVNADTNESQRKLFVVLQEYQAPKSIDPVKAETRLQIAINSTLEVLEINSRQLFIKTRKQQKGLSQYEKSSSSGTDYIVTENDLRFIVNFEKYLDTGLFIDHRNTRYMLKQLAADTRFLNLFAYTGSASVYAAAGKAHSCTTVDMSNTYLTWAKKNMLENKLNDPKHNQFIQADCIKWLKTCDQQFDLIFLDPPSFSSSKRMQSSFDVQRDHVDLIQSTMRLLSNNGILIFSNNRRKFKMCKNDLKQFEIRDISKRTIPKDFERRPNIHNCWRLSHI